MKFDGELELQAALNELSEVSKIRPIRAAFIKAVANIALNLKEYKLVVHSVEKNLYKAEPEGKLVAVYVIDSICRQSRIKFGLDRDVFSARFAIHIQETIANIKDVPDYDQEPLLRLLRSWREKAFFRLPDDDENLVKLLGWEGHLHLMDPGSKQSDYSSGISSPDRSLFSIDSDDNEEALITTSVKVSKVSHSAVSVSVSVMGGPRSSTLTSGPRGVPIDPRKRFLGTLPADEQLTKKTSIRRDDIMSGADKASSALHDSSYLSSMVERDSTNAEDVSSALSQPEKKKREKKVVFFENLIVLRFHASSPTWLFSALPNFDDNDLLCPLPLSPIIKDE